MSAVIVTVVAIALMAMVAIVIVAIKLMCVCETNEVLILSGKKEQLDNGKKVGYRTIAGGGRTIRKPFIEVVDRMDLTNMVIQLEIRGAFSKGGIPLNVEGVAIVSISSRQPTLTNAIERFLGKKRSEIITTARETLEGNLRGVLATLTPEEVNDDREKFSESLTQEAHLDLQVLGLNLASLKIQHVSDDVGFLDSIGRKRTAELLMRSRVAEADNTAQSAERSASNKENAEIAKIEAAISTARAEAQRRIVDAQTKMSAMVAEQVGQVAAAVTKAQAEVGVQEARIEQVKLQLQADKIRPAEAKKAQMIAQARGQSAQIVEHGKATAQAMTRVADMWKLSGDAARQAFVAQQLRPLVRELMSTVGEIPVDKVTFIDKELNDGGNIATKAAVVSEQLKHMTGVDLPALAKRLGAETSVET